MPQVKLILIVVALVGAWMAMKRPEGGTAEVRRATGSAAEGRGRQGAGYLALGDSYTIGESVTVAERYPEQMRRLLMDNGHLAFGEPEIIAVTGWTTGDLLEALSAARPEPGYRLVSLQIGVNNQFQGRSREEYREQFGMLLRQCIRLAGNEAAHVVVLSIPDYSVTPFGRLRDTAAIAAQIDSFNRINFELASEYKVNYVDVTAESRKAGKDASLIAADGLHFSGKEYGSWAKLMEPVVRKALQ